MFFATLRALTTGTILQTARFTSAFIAPRPSIPASFLLSSRRSMHRTITHTFAGLGLDRNVPEIKEPGEFAKAIADPASLFMPLYEAKPLVRKTASGPPQVAWQSLQVLHQSVGISAEEILAPAVVSDSSPRRPPLCIALGRDEAGWRFALDVTGRLPSREETEAQLQQPPPSSSSSFESVRALLAVMEPREVAVAGQAAALMSWHAINLFCGVCGSPMVPAEAGSRRKCTSCRNRAYPRTDPVGIVLVYDPSTDKCLLGRQRVYRPGMYSCLAGFVEQCESLEEAVRREVKEEAGVEVGRLVYHSSQPWPIGRGASCQLMVGFIAEATSTTIRIDTQELEDARWFSREEVAAARELVVVPTPGASGGAEAEGEALSIPGPYAIAHHLIKHWLSLPPRHRL